MTGAKKPRISKRNTGGSAKGANAIRVLLEEDTLSPGVKGIPGFIDKVVGSTMRYYEPQVENYAKQNAPWTDQTTNARNGLAARSGKEKDAHYIVLAHQVPYGIWLEVRWSGRYAVILPTIEVFGPKVMDTISKILDRYDGGQ